MTIEASSTSTTTTARCSVVISNKDWPWPLPKIEYKPTAADVKRRKQEAKKAATAAIQDASGEVDLNKLDLDAGNWKEQDHYILLGLGDERYLATDAAIKKNYRKQILKYHPDKKSQAGEESANIDNIFKCIQKAYEILSDPVRRKQFDSCDPTFDDTLPPVKKAFTSPQQFFDLYGPVFEENARFSTTAAPSLGDMTTSRAEVEAFYAFWYNFDSWRSFEYLDEEESSHADNRQDKRYLEKKNKAARAKRKTEDNARLRKLIDQAVDADPRIKAFKEQDRLEKDKKKNEKKAQEEAAKAAALKAAEEEKARKEAEAAAVKDREAAAKKAKEAEKSAIRREKKAIKAIFKDNGYYLADSKDLVTMEKNIVMLDTLIEKLDLLRLTDLKNRMEAEPAFGMDLIVEMNTSGSLSPSKAASSAALPVAAVATAAETPASGAPAAKTTAPEWTVLEMQELINAVNKIPGGTSERWEKIAEYVALHAKTPLRPTKQYIEKSNELQKGIKEAAELHVTEELQKQQPKKKMDSRIFENTPTYNPHPLSDSTETVPIAGSEGTTTGPAWTKDEQALLESLMKTHPSTDPERWDKISAGMIGRSKRDIIQRVKELAQVLQAKKAAAATKTE